MFAECIAIGCGRILKLGVANRGAVTASEDGIHHGERAADPKGKAKEEPENCWPVEGHSVNSLQCHPRLAV